MKKRPQIAGWHAQIGATLSDPELVVELPGGGTGYYRRGLLGGQQANCYLFVVVRWYGALGDIATAFPVLEIQPYEKVLRMKK